MNLHTGGALRWRRHGHGVSTTAPATHGHTTVAYNGCLYTFGGDVKDNKRVEHIHKYSLGESVRVASGLWRVALR